jgi:hypothetical protein
MTTQKIYIFNEYFYRDDSYGDPLCDFNIAYSKEDISQERMRILNKNSAASGSYSY